MSEENSSIPRGYCQCGCGQRTRVSQRDYPKYGHVKGEPISYIHGHHRRKAEYQIEDHGFSTPCWIWQGHLSSDGYASQIIRDHRRCYAHVHFYEQKYGGVERGLELDHLCRVRACVNPDHLEPVTRAVNVQRGANAKLDNVKVAEMRLLYADGGWTYSALARKYGVTHCVASRVIRGLSWVG